MNTIHLARTVIHACQSCRLTLKTPARRYLHAADVPRSLPAANPLIIDGKPDHVREILIAVG